MGEAPNPAAITIRPAVAEDADAITRTYLESAEYHAQLDPERYSVPASETIAARYREGRQHSPYAAGMAITLVAETAAEVDADVGAELGAEPGREVVGFVDARLVQSPDPMHRELTYCHVVEIAVNRRSQKQGIGRELLHAAEDWGRRQGAEFALLEYLAGNTRASDFYQQRMGYRPAAVTAIKRL